MPVEQDQATRFSFGPNSQNLGNHSWYGRNANGVPVHPVGVQSSNRFGLHDMHGNLREWCQDRYPNNIPTPRKWILLDHLQEN